MEKIDRQDMVTLKIDGERQTRGHSRDKEESVFKGHEQVQWISGKA